MIFTWEIEKKRWRGRGFGGLEENRNKRIK